MMWVLVNSGSLAFRELMPAEAMSASLTLITTRDFCAGHSIDSTYSNLCAIAVIKHRSKNDLGPASGGE